MINLIEKYSLYQYDQSETEREKIKREDRVFSEINADIPIEGKKFTPVTTPAQTTIENYYIVKSGDTLFRIAQQYKLTVDELKSLNQLKEDTIKVGQKLRVVK
ncbi:LysM domain protein [compost metagenome]